MLSEQEIVRYRNLISETMALQPDPDYYFDDPLKMANKVNDLAREDHEAFLALCKQLLRDKEQIVRRGLLLVLSRYTQKDRELEQLLIEEALDEEALQSATLLVLARVATRAALPTLYHFANNGQVWALSGLDRLVRTEREVQAAVRLARRYILAPEYRLRETALRILRRRSNIKQEEDLLLEAVRLYKDEIFIEALRNAEPTRVLPELKMLAGQVTRNSTAFEDLSKTITILEGKLERTLQSEAGNGYLQELPSTINARSNLLATIDTYLLQS
jgi:hypothetical protein